MLNVEVVARTFRPLWKTKIGFHIQDASDHFLLFVFEEESDVEKVLWCEPWSIDKHLVLFNWYDHVSKLENIDLTKTKFWVQIHNLPFLNMSFELVEPGETTGLVVKLWDKSKMRGSNFMRVRVVVDTTQPLCRGRKIIFPCGEEG